MNKTLVTFLLDRTGSMQAIRGPTIEAFNAYLAELKKGEGIEFTFLQFDSISLDKLCVGMPVRDVAPLTFDTFEPRAWTPLIDAVYKTVKAVKAQIADLMKKNFGQFAPAVPPKVVICIQTDGQENASREYNWQQLNDLIKSKIGLGWQFNFMGASIDAYAQGAQMGIPRGSTVSYDSGDAGATRSVFTATASNATGYASGRLAGSGYSAADKAAAGDRYQAPPMPPPNPPTPSPPPGARPDKVAAKAIDDFSL